jgi:multicomponent Na+:H+ antiporter subunit G
MSGGVLETVLEVLTAACLVLGGALSAIAGIGLLRYPDALSRLHAATKPQILGLAFILAAVALDDRSWATLLPLGAVLLVQVLTTPISGHMVGRAGYRTGNFRRELLVTDELEDDIARADRSGSR